MAAVGACGALMALTRYGKELVVLVFRVEIKMDYIILMLLVSLTLVVTMLPCRLTAGCCLRGTSQHTIVPLAVGRSWIFEPLPLI